MVCAAVALALVGTPALLAAMRANQSVPNLALREVVEIRMCEWRMAWRDIVPSFSTKDLRAAPHQLWFSFAHAGKVSQPNEKGWVWGALLVPGKNPGEWIMYGGQKQQGRWLLRRVPMAPS